MRKLLSLLLIMVVLSVATLGFSDLNKLNVGLDAVSAATAKAAATPAPAAPVATPKPVVTPAPTPKPTPVPTPKPVVTPAPVATSKPVVTVPKPVVTPKPALTPKPVATPAPVAKPAPIVPTKEQLQKIAAMEILLKNANGDKVARVGILKQLVALRLEAGDVSIPVIVNGAVMKSDVASVIRSQRTLVPVRAMAAVFGATVDWNAQNPEWVTITKDVRVGEQPLVFLMNLKTGVVTMNNILVDLEVNPIVIMHRAMVPIRFIAEAFGMTVAYDPGTRGVFIDTIIKEPVTQGSIAPEPAAQSTVVQSDDEEDDD